MVFENRQDILIESRRSHLSLRFRSGADLERSSTRDRDEGNRSARKQEGPHGRGTPTLG